MKDQRTLAFINAFAVLGALRQLCELSAEARAIVGGETVSVGFAVKDGPEMTLFFEEGRCRMEPGTANCDIKLPFISPEKFNGMISGTFTPIPSRGFSKLKFLTGSFVKLTNLLSSYLRPKGEALKDEAFFVASTTLMFHVIVGAVAQIGNEEKIGQASAEYIADGVAKLSIGGGPSAGILAKDHRLTAIHRDVKDYLSIMELRDIHLARDLFEGKVNAMACIADGSIRVAGMVSQIDNINRILDRVALYL